MQTNWNVILNVLLLLGVIISIRRLVKVRSQRVESIGHPIGLQCEEREPRLGDDIIAVRRISPTLSEDEAEEDAKEALREEVPSISLQTASIREHVADQIETQKTKELVEQNTSALVQQSPILMMFLLAKENRQLAGYELLQSLLAAGLSFGQGSLFHRHQYPNAQGPVLCSLAAATPNGTFDLQNIGAFSVKGLCLFMPISSNSTIDTARFTILYQIATQLRDGLDAYLLDDKKQRLTQASFNRYATMLNNQEVGDLYTRSPYF